VKNRIKMKKIFGVVLIVVTSTISIAQNINDFGRIVLNTHMQEYEGIPASAVKMLKNKLDQIATKNGIGGSEVNPRFIITAEVNITTKDIIPGPPQMIAQNLDITFFIGDAIDNVKFSSTTFSLKGVGTNETKAFIGAFKTINPNKTELKELVEEAEKEIISYYNSKCEFIKKESATMVSQGNFDEAIYKLSLIPEVCQDCYYECLDLTTTYYQQKIDADCKVKFNEAKVTWTAEQTPNGAEKAGDILSTINPMANCQTDVTAFIKAIDAKLKADEKARWQFKMKQYADKIAMQKEQVRIAEEKGKRDDNYRENQSQRDAISQEKQSSRNFELDKINSNNSREIAVEYARNQPKTVTYNNIHWR
jgi:hypothetical protein